MHVESKHKYLDVMMALIFLVPAIVVFQQSATSLTEQGVASGDVMNNAAMFPQLLAGLLGTLAIVQLVLTLRLPAKISEHKQPFMLGNSILVMIILAGYLLTLPILGYHIVTPILSFIILLLFKVKPVIAVTVALLMSIVVALFFETALKVILPVGLFEIALPF